MAEPLLNVQNISVSIDSKQVLKNLNLKINPGETHVLMGPNGAGKSTFLKVLSGDLEHDSGTISMTPGERMAVLKQDHFAYDEYSVKDTVMMGYPKLYEVAKARESIYEKEDFKFYAYDMLNYPMCYGFYCMW